MRLKDPTVFCEEHDVFKVKNAYEVAACVICLTEDNQ